MLEQTPNVAPLDLVVLLPVLVDRVGRATTGSVRSSRAVPEQPTFRDLGLRID